MAPRGQFLEFKFLNYPKPQFRPIRATNQPDNSRNITAAKFNRPPILTFSKLSPEKSDNFNNDYFYEGASFGNFNTSLESSNNFLNMYALKFEVYELFIGLN